MCVCVCVYVYIYAYTCMYVCLCNHIYIYVCVCKMHAATLRYTIRKAARLNGESVLDNDIILISLSRELGVQGSDAVVWLFPLQSSG